MKFTSRSLLAAGVVLALSASVNAQGTCSVTDFSVVGPYTSSPEQCDADGCNWYLETRYADCETFCNDNLLQCVAAHMIGDGTSFVGCSGAEAANLTEISCVGDGTPKARFSRTCTCEPIPERCTITDFSVVGPYTSSPEQCEADGCNWYLETRYADCETFCNDNGLECEAAYEVGEGTSFVGCSGAEAAGLTEISCVGDGTPKARFSRTCSCKPRKCSITDFSVVRPYTSSPDQCNPTGCDWYLETRYADCETFCNENGLECAAAYEVGEGTSFVGCSGAEAAGLTEISCVGDGTPKARFSRTCSCQSHDREFSPVTDGCKNQNTEVADACLPATDKAAIRCCSKDGQSNFCDSFCGGVSHTLADYYTAVETCEAEGLRLCTRAEIDARDCCGTGCQFDGHQTWILESC